MADCLYFRASCEGHQLQANGRSVYNYLATPAEKPGTYFSKLQLVILCLIFETVHIYTEKKIVALASMLLKLASTTLNHLYKTRGEKRTPLANLVTAYVGNHVCLFGVAVVSRLLLHP